LHSITLLSIIFCYTINSLAQNNKIPSFCKNFLLS
jgi:hypothetical protein